MYENQQDNQKHLHSCNYAITHHVSHIKLNPEKVLSLNIPTESNGCMKGKKSI